MAFINEYASWVFLVSICLLACVFFMLLGVRLSTWRKTRATQKAYQELEKFYGEYCESNKNPRPSSRRKLKRLFFTKKGVVRIAAALELLPQEELDEIYDMFHTFGYGSFLIQQLKSSDAKYVILVMRVLGALRVTPAAPIIKAILIDNQDNLDMQYIGLLSLSLMGAERPLISLFKSSSYTVELSFRCLSEVYKAFGGDKDSFYRTSLSLKNVYCRRLALKRIAAEKRLPFAPLIYGLTRANNCPLEEYIDVIRTLGILEYAPSEDMIREATRHRDWRVRNVAYVALGSIAGQSAQEVLVKGLSDDQWWVRKNAAKVLVSIPQTAALKEQVNHLNDRYAHEILLAEMRKHALCEASAQ